MRISAIIMLVFVAIPVLAQEKRNQSRKYYQEGENAFNDGNYTDALKSLNLCLQADPSFAEGYLTRAATREQLDDLKGAHTDYSIYLELRPDQPEALYSLAVVRYRLGMYETAKKDLLKLLTLPPGETTTVYFKLSASPSGTNQITTAQSAIRPQLYNYLGLVETKLGNFPTAITWLDSAIALVGKEPDYYVNRGLAREENKDNKGAIADYKLALLINPEHAAALHNLAVLSKLTGDNTSALEQLEKAIESDSSMLYPYLERAYRRMEGGYYKGAIDDYNRALEINDSDPEIWLSRGIAREKSNDLRGAFSDYTKAIELEEKFERAWLNRGNVLTKQGKYREACEDYTVAITFNPGYAFAYYNRAIARQKLKQHAEACSDLQKAEEFGQEVSQKMKNDFCK